MITYGQKAKNWYYKNNVTVFDTLSSAIGFLEEPKIEDWESIQLYNLDKSECILQEGYFKLRDDYEIFAPIKVIGEINEWYQITTEGSKLYRKSDSTLTFHTWEEHIVNSVVAVGFNPGTNPIRKKPNEQSEELYYDHNQFYHPIKIEGDWLYVSKYDKDYGWIKWKSKDYILIDCFYLL